MPRRLATLLLTLALAGTAGAQESQPLNIGDPAPAIDIAHFFQGEPVAKFAKDRIYVLEFWATW